MISFPIRRSYSPIRRGRAGSRTIGERPVADTRGAGRAVERRCGASLGGLIGRLHVEVAVPYYPGSV
jgi:hypothetical protein